MNTTYRMRRNFSIGSWPNSTDYCQIKIFNDEVSYKNFINKNDTSMWQDDTSELKRGTYVNTGSIMFPVWKKV